MARAIGLLQGREAVRVAEAPPSLDDLRRHIRECRPAVIFLDHLALMKMPRRGSRYEEVAETTRPSRPWPWKPGWRWWSWCR